MGTAASSLSRTAAVPYPADAKVHGAASTEGSERPTDACAALNRHWPGFVDSLTTSWHAGAAASWSPPPARGVGAPPTVAQADFPAAPRVVAIGDLHGDFAKTVAALKLGGLVDEQLRWSGGKTVLVQVGDVLDRGGQEVQIFFLLERLQAEAAASGGRVHVLNGNHESMNVSSAARGHARFRYATRGGLDEFARWREAQRFGACLKGRCGFAAGICAPGDAPSPAEAPHDGSTPHAPATDAASAARAAALCPGCPLARRFLEPHPFVLTVGSTAFVHGGILSEHTTQPRDAINAAGARWLSGDHPAERTPAFLGGERALVWARQYGHPDPSKCDCSELDAALAAMPGVARVVVGHTIQPPAVGINSVCGGRAVRVDVGMSAGCGGFPPGVLEIVDDGKQMFRIVEGAGGLPVREAVAGPSGAKLPPPPPPPMEEERKGG